MLITLETVRDEWSACPEYTADRLAALYPVPRTPIEILTLTDGPWAEVPAAYRLWTVFHEGVLSDRILRLSACDSAERALTREREAGREPHRDSWNAVAVAKRFALGVATAEEMDVARAAARAAAHTAFAAFYDRGTYADANTAADNAAAAFAAAAFAAANTAADNAAAAFAATTYAATAYAAAATAYAAFAAERRTQVDRLLTISEENA